MAISDVQEYTHLTDEEVEQLGRGSSTPSVPIEESRGDSDAAYINRLIRIQRYLAVAGGSRLVGTQGRRTRVPAAVAGATSSVSTRSSRTWRSATTSCTASGTG